jgi:GNAT superfamily N-acetyltransferase
MSLDAALEGFPKEIVLKDGLRVTLRPLEAADETALVAFFQAVPPQERLFIKHRVTEPEVIREWCRNIDMGRILPIVALADGRIIGDVSLHQTLGGWKRHIGRVSVLVHPGYRGRGLARILVEEILDIARQCGLERAEAEFLGSQELAMKTFGLVGFSRLVHLPDYVKDMQAITHDYVLMGMSLKTDEEYTGMG